MMRRITSRVRVAGSGLVVVLAVAGGCQPRNRMDLRQPMTVAEGHAPVVAASAEEGVETGRDETLKAPKGFFRNTRLQGGWSSEANEIERDLGIEGR